MDAGLRIINESGVVQIDSTYSNYYLHSQQVTTLASSSANVLLSTSEISVPFPGQCLIAIRSAVPVSVAGSTANTVAVVGAKSSAGASVTVYFFVPANLSPLVGTGEGGLRVFGPTGNLVFDNSAKMVKILSYVPHAVDGQSVNLGASGTYAAVVLNEEYAAVYNRLSGGGALNNASWTETRTHLLVQVTSTGCYFTNTSWTSGSFLASDNPPPQPVLIGPKSVLLLDVTNY